MSHLAFYLNRPVASIAAGLLQNRGGGCGMEIDLVNQHSGMVS